MAAKASRQRLMSATVAEEENHNQWRNDHQQPAADGQCRNALLTIMLFLLRAVAVVLSIDVDEHSNTVYLSTEHIYFEVDLNHRRRLYVFRNIDKYLKLKYCECEAVFSRLILMLWDCDLSRSVSRIYTIRLTCFSSVQTVGSFHSKQY